MQACRAVSNLCYGGSSIAAVAAEPLCVGAAGCADDAAGFRWAAHAIWNLCTHDSAPRRAVVAARGLEVLAAGLGRWREPRARRYGLRALASVRRADFSSTNRGDAAAAT